jgi:hypothetical protein
MRLPGLGKIGEQVPALIGRNQDLGRPGGKAGAFRNYRNACFGAIRAGHNPANVIDVNGHHPTRAATVMVKPTATMHRYSTPRTIMWRLLSRFALL